MRILRRALVTALAVAFIVPSVATATWPVTNRYSWVSQWYTPYHLGIDVATPLGTRIVPMRSGVVIWAGYKPDCGAYQVWVSHGNGLYSVYLHMSRVYAWRGEWVNAQSTTLGLVGESGCATGPHVHVTVWHGYPWAYGSYRVNPWPYIDSGWYLPYRYE